MPRSFEDFSPGTVIESRPLAVTRDAIVAFARAYDPQPFHVDEAAARETFVGRLIASGWHSCAINMRLIADSFLLDSMSMGAPGIEEVRWLKPVLPGDALRTRSTVLEARPSRTKPDRGLVHFRFDLLNQADEAVLSQQNWILMGRRGAEPVPREGAERPSEGNPEAEALSPEISESAANLFFEDLEVGQVRDVGSFMFSAEEIVSYAREFDPQPFHVDPEAARRSHFGGLVASGWQTAAAWMKLTVAYRERGAAAARARGERPAVLGPSPGFKNLQWLKPVYAGDRIRYRSTLVEKRASGSRPDWGLVFQHNTGDNQHGEPVFGFDSAVFWPMRSRA